MQIYLARNNQQAGPYSLEQLNQMLANQQVLLTDLAWHEGMHEWKPLGELTQGQHYYQPNASVAPTSTPFTQLNKTRVETTKAPALEDASLGRRFFAKLLDMLLWIPGFALPNILMNETQSAEMMALQEQVMNKTMTIAQAQQNMLEIIPQYGWYAMFAYFFIMLFIQAALLGTTGQSIGKKLTKIKIVDFETGDKVPLTRVFLIRSMLMVMINLFFIPIFISIIDYMFALSDKKQTLHDKLAKTKVVQYTK